MNLWKWLALEAVVLSSLITGVALAIQFDLEWLRVAAITVGIGGTAVVMVAKRQRQRSTLSAEPDSVESARDLSARATAYLDVLLITSAALVIGTLRPSIPLPAALITLLGLYGLAYWGRRALATRK